MRPLLVEGRCVREWSPFSQCVECVEACPRGAVSVEGRRVKILEDLCSMCGACMRACPTEALVASEPYVEIAKKVVVDDDGTASLMCGRDVNCIAHVDDSLVLALRARGAKRVEVIHCRSCPRGVDVARERERLGGLGVVFAEMDPVSTELPQRRMRRLELVGRYVARPRIVKREGVWLVRGVPEKRELLLWALRELRGGEVAHGQFVGKRIRTDLCEYHGTCAALCPTGALQSDGKGALYHRPDICVRCKNCLVSCLLNAVENTKVDMADVLEGRVHVLASFRLKRCVECGAWFPEKDGEAKCPSCRRLSQELRQIFGEYRDSAHI